MATETSLWRDIRDTRKHGSEETRSVSRRMPFGVLQRLDISWTAVGQGEADTRYALDVVETQPKGLVAAAVEPDPSLLAILSKHAPAPEGYGETKTVYLAQLAAGELVKVEGRVHDLSECQDGGLTDFSLWAPPTMTPEEALAGFESALADAHFA